MIRIEHILLGAATLLLISIIASKVSARLGFPVLLSFLATGCWPASTGLEAFTSTTPIWRNRLGWWRWR